MTLLANRQRALSRSISAFRPSPTNACVSLTPAGSRALGKRVIDGERDAHQG
jgi:hypothetical protein